MSAPLATGNRELATVFMRGRTLSLSFPPFTKAVKWLILVNAAVYLLIEMLKVFSPDLGDAVLVITARLFNRLNDPLQRCQVVWCHSRQGDVVWCHSGQGQLPTALSHAAIPRRCDVGSQAGKKPPQSNSYCSKLFLSGQRPRRMPRPAKKG